MNIGTYFHGLFSFGEGTLHLVLVAPRVSKPWTRPDEINRRSTSWISYYGAMRTNKWLVMGIMTVIWGPFMLSLRWFIQRSLYAPDNPPEISCFILYYLQNFCIILQYHTKNFQQSCKFCMTDWPRWCHALQWLITKVYDIQACHKMVVMNANAKCLNFLYGSLWAMQNRFFLLGEPE